jgi:hypothetical protein
MSRRKRQTARPVATGQRVADPAPQESYQRDDLRLDETPKLRAVAPQPAAPQPRRFGKPRTYHLDGGFKVTITGEGDALEGDFAVSSEQDSLLIFTGDAAIQRRIARQHGSLDPLPLTPHLDRFVQTSGPRSLSASAPAGVGDPVAHPDRPYDGIGQRPRDLQEQELAGVGMNMDEIGASLGLG